MFGLYKNASYFAIGWFILLVVLIVLFTTVDYFKSKSTWVHLLTWGSMAAVGAAGSWWFTYGPGGPFANSDNALNLALSTLSNSTNTLPPVDTGLQDVVSANLDADTTANTEPSQELQTPNDDSSLVQSTLDM